MLRLTALVLLLPAVALTQTYATNLPLVDYDRPAKANPVARLKGAPDLPELLRALHINIDSQLLVFSKTSVQAANISPRNPRAIYFNDEVAVATVRGSDEIELAALDRDLGTVFYTLRGGRITPGTYDLTRAQRLGQATGWSGSRAVALSVAENPSGGTLFNWAGAAPNGATDTWTASFTDAPHAQITFTCGRTGTVTADFSASANALDLRLPDGADGQLHLSFARRS